MRRVLLCCFALFGCGSVPDVVFTDPDAAASDSSAGIDASDAASQSVCPSSPPVGADTCCGNIACVGNCDGDHCQECEDRCGQGELCCPVGNSVKCRALADGC